MHISLEKLICSVKALGLENEPKYFLETCVQTFTDEKQLDPAWWTYNWLIEKMFHAWNGLA